MTWTMQARCTPGDGLAMVGDQVWALVALAAEDPRVHTSQLALRAGGGIDELLECLLSGGLRAAPDFALCAPLDGARWRVVLRGQAVAEVGSGGGATTVRCRGVLLDQESEPADRLGLQLAVAGSDQFGPAAPGLQPARELVVERCQVTQPAPAPAVSAQPDPLPWMVLAESAPSAPSAPGAAPPLPSASAAPGSPSRYDSLFDGGASGPPAPAAFIDTVPGFPPQSSQPAAAATVVPEARTEPPAQQRSVAAPPPPVPPSSGVLPPSAGPDDGRTVNRAELRADQAGAESLVRAVHCPAGHPNPPFATTCRVCSAAVPEQQAVEIARPPLGRLLVAGASSVTLDRDVVLGRNPRVPDGYRSQPHLVRLNDPRQEVSGLHAVLSLRQWHVSLTDLGSTNGTEIITPDGRRQRLVPDSAVIIEPGTTIVLAEVLDLRFEAAG